MTRDDVATLCDLLAAIDMRIAALEDIVSGVDRTASVTEEIQRARETMRLEVNYAFDNAVSDAWRPATKPPETQESP